MVALALSTAMVFLLMAAQEHRTLGSLFVGRIWQGKIVFLAVLVPLLFVLLQEYAGRPTGRPLVLLVAGGAAGVGLTSTGTFLVPVLAVGCLAPLALRATRQAAVGFAAVAAYPLGALLVSTAVGGRRAGGDLSSDVVADEIARFVLGSGLFAFIAVAAALFAPVVLASRARGLHGRGHRPPRRLPVRASRAPPRLGALGDRPHPLAGGLGRARRRSRRRRRHGGAPSRSTARPPGRSRRRFSASCSWSGEPRSGATAPWRGSRRGSASRGRSPRRAGSSRTPGQETSSSLPPRSARRSSSCPTTSRRSARGPSTSGLSTRSPPRTCSTASCSSRSSSPASGRRSPSCRRRRRPTPRSSGRSRRWASTSPASAAGRGRPGRRCGRPATGRSSAPAASCACGRAPA